MLRKERGEINNGEWKKVDFDRRAGDRPGRCGGGSIPADGSSSKIIGGLPTIAIATESFRVK